jgi:serine/threonine-protein kinase
VSIPIGTQLGPYEVLAPVGAGGMGQVYKARDTRLDRSVAIKVIAWTSASGTEPLERFRREARAISRLNHPHICTLHDVGEAAGIPFLVMEYLEGATLAERLDKGPLGLPEALGIAVQIAEALDRAHREGIVHRDLKPANVMLTRDGAKVLDFGLAKLWQPAEAGSERLTATASAPLTESGRVLGTVPYMSPEQVEGRALDARTDIFSLGVMLYEMVRGTRPFKGDSRAGLMAAILGREAPPLASAGGSAPPALQRLVQRCLAKHPDERWQSAKDLAAELRFILEADRRSEAPEAGAGALAILPFRPLVAQAADEALELGIADALITAVCGTGEIVVRPLLAAQRAAGRRDDPEALGRELGVACFLDGSIQRDGGRIRVNARLVRAADGVSLWAGGFVEDATSLFEVQVAIAERIAAAIAPRLGGAAHGRLVKRHTDKPDAYAAFLAGRYNLVKGVDPEDGLPKALAFFQQATGLDPRFALAWVGVSEAYSAHDWNGLLSTKQSNPQAKTAAETALVLDEGLAEAHVALATARLLAWEWTGAESAYRRALDLNPNLASAHQGYALFLTAMRRFDEALAEMRRAQRLDPTSLSIQTHVSLVLQFDRRFEEAEQQCRRVLEVEPAFVEARFCLGLVYSSQGRGTDAIREYESLSALAAGNPDFLAMLGHSHALAGNRAKVDEIRSRLAALSAERYSPGFWIACLELGLGDLDEAMRFLEKAYDDPDDSFTLAVNCSPLLDPLRSNPRFQQLLRRMGFPEGS